MDKHPETKEDDCAPLDFAYWEPTLDGEDHLVVDLRAAEQLSARIGAQEQSREKPSRERFIKSYELQSGKGLLVSADIHTRTQLSELIKQLQFFETLLHD